MTCYNRSDYISQAIESVLSSDFSDFELIICDDASTDRTVEICREYARSDNRVIVHVNETNIGDYPNRNKAASYASGKYLKYVDSDDMIYPWALGLMVSMMERFPDAGWGLCSMEPNNEKIFPFLLAPADAFRYHYFGPGLFKRSPLSSIIKKDVFSRVGGFRPMRMVGDYDMWQRLAMQFGVVLMPQGMVWYRSHGNQEFSDFVDYIPHYEKVKLEHLLSGSCPLDMSEINLIIKSEKYKLIKHLVKTFLKGNIKAVNNLLPVLRQYIKQGKTAAR